MNFAPTDEQKMVREMVRKFAETQIKPIAAELDRTHRHPEEICRQLGEMGLMGVAGQGHGAWRQGTHRLVVHDLRGEAPGQCAQQDVVCGVGGARDLDRADLQPARVVADLAAQRMGQ